MSSNDPDDLMRREAFKRVATLSKMHGHLTQREFGSAFRSLTGSAGFSSQDKGMHDVTVEVRLPIGETYCGVDMRPRSKIYACN